MFARIFFLFTSSKKSSEKVSTNGTLDPCFNVKKTLHIVALTPMENDNSSYAGLNFFVKTSISQLCLISKSGFNKRSLFRSSFNSANVISLNNSLLEEDFLQTNVCISKILKSKAARSTLLEEAMFMSSFETLSVFTTIGRTIFCLVSLSFLEPKNAIIFSLCV